MPLPPRSGWLSDRHEEEAAEKALVVDGLCLVVCPDTSALDEIALLEASLGLGGLLLSLIVGADLLLVAASGRELGLEVINSRSLGLFLLLLERAQVDLAILGL